MKVHGLHVGFAYKRVVLCCAVQLRAGALVAVFKALLPATREFLVTGLGDHGGGLAGLRCYRPASHPTHLLSSVNSLVIELLLSLAQGKIEK